MAAPEEFKEGVCGSSNVDIRMSKTNRRLLIKSPTWKRDMVIAMRAYSLESSSSESEYL